MNVLVTGAAGFIGFHTAMELLKEGHIITLIDNFNDYYEPALKRSRAKMLFDSYGVQVLEVDVTDYSRLEEVFMNNDFKKIFHSAAQAGVRFSIENPFIYEKTNIRGTLNLLELSRRYNIEQFVLSSSSSVYGSREKAPFSEEDKVDRPISVYAASKKSNEELCFTYWHLYGIKCTCLRFFTVYGPWGRPDMAIFKFTKNILEKKPIEVYNSGKMKRDFTFISDIVSGVVSALKTPFDYEIFNLARGEALNLLDFINEIEKSTGIKADMKMMELQPGDVRITNADISKARKMLNYQPGVSTAEGIKMFVDWYIWYHNINL